MGLHGSPQFPTVPYSDEGHGTALLAASSEAVRIGVRPAGGGRDGSRWARGRAAAGVAVVAALVAGACSTTRAGGAVEGRLSPPTTEAVATSSTAVPPAGAPPPVRWLPCGSGRDCATVDVPLDYAHPNGPKIPIALTRRPASGPTRIGSLLVNPGGPGESGVSSMGLFESILSKNLLDHFDLVAFDPRGVGASDGVQCLDGPGLDRWLNVDPVPATPAALATLVAADREFVTACQAHSGAILAYVGTANAARDMDRIRAALGDAKLTYLGFSYGTELGAFYADEFPTHVRAMVLDGAVDPAVDPVTADKVQAAGFDKELADFFADCAASLSCPWRPPGFDGTPSSLHSAYDRLMHSIEAHPLVVGARAVGPGQAFLGVVTPLYSRGSWPALALALASAQAGNGAPLLELFDSYVQRQPDGTYSDSLAANAAITCADQRWPTDPAAYPPLAAAAAKVAPEFGPANIYGSLTCAVWPVRGGGHPHAVSAVGAPPIVIVGSTGDPATPYSWAKALASELRSGVLLTRDGEGHTGYEASACIRADVDAYLIGLSPPPPGIVCPSP